MRCFILPAFCLFFTVTPALACLNDTKTSAVEEEFRSAYNRAAPIVENPASHPWGIIVLGAGLGLILGSGIAIAVVALRK